MVYQNLVKLIKTSLDGNQSKVKIVKYLYYSFPIENGFKQGDALSALIFTFALEYSIRKVQETNSGLDKNGPARYGLCG